MTASLGEPLTYPLAGLLREPPGATRLYPVAGVTIDLGEDLELADPIEGTIRVSRTNRGVLVHGHLDTAIVTQCSRCLRDIEVPLELEIEEEGAAKHRRHLRQAAGLVERARRWAETTTSAPPVTDRAS